MATVVAEAAGCVQHAAAKCCNSSSTANVIEIFHVRLKF